MKNEGTAINNEGGSTKQKGGLSDVHNWAESFTMGLALTLILTLLIHPGSSPNL